MSVFLLKQKSLVVMTGPGLRRELSSLTGYKRDSSTNITELKNGKKVELRISAKV